jgi:hypothetical protein
MPPAPKKTTQENKMGIMKAKMFEDEARRDWAQRLLRKSGAGEECEHHGCLVDCDDADAVEEAVAQARRTPAGGLTPDEAEELVRSSLDDFGVECPGCAHNAQE